MSFCMQERQSFTPPKLLVVPVTPPSWGKIYFVNAVGTLKIVLGVKYKFIPPLKRPYVCIFSKIYKITEIFFEFYQKEVFGFLRNVDCLGLELDKL